MAAKHITKRRSKCGMSHTSCRDSDVEEDRRGPSAKRFKMNTVDTQNNNFLFTSESVGEGHPGKAPKIRLNCLSSCIVIHNCTCAMFDVVQFFYNLHLFADKICDQISDAILDAHLKQDPDAKVACGKLLAIAYWGGFLKRRCFEIKSIHIVSSLSEMQLKESKLL